MGYSGYFDGACEPINPGGTASYGAVICRGDVVIWEEGKIVGKGPDISNNVAEYAGLLALLDCLIAMNLSQESITIMGDSKLVINQMWGSWRMNGGLYISVAKKCRERLKLFPNIKGKWIPREQNDHADKMSKDALRSAGVRFRIQPE